MSNIPDLLDYLVTTFTNSVTLGAATPPVKVIDGPVQILDPLPLALWVGVDDITAARDGNLISAGASQQNWAGFGRLSRDEQAAISCVAGAWTGNNTFSPLRAAASAIVDAVEAIVKADTTAPALFPNPGVTAAEWLQENTGNGLQVFVQFQIIYKVRL